MATDPDDPFAPRSDDRTVMVPTPRKAAPRPAAPGQQPAAPPPRQAAPPPPPPPPPPTRGSGGPSLESLPDMVGSNPLIAAATPILDLIPQLRVAAQADPVAVKNNLVNGIRSFEQAARRAQVPSEVVVAARYALCTFVDETAGNTPWGGSGQWATQSLLVTFHNEAWGGEKTFQLLAKLAEDPNKNRDLLSLLEVCLAMGFQGRYRVLDNGQAQLTQVRERLFEILRPGRGEPEKELSPRWKGASIPRNAILSALPLWVVAAATALILTVTFLVLVSILNRKSDPVFAGIRGIVPPAAEQRAAPPVSAPAPPRLRVLLASDITAGLVDVGDYADRSVVTIRSDGFFSPGSDSIPDKMLPLLDRIGAALKQVPGKVLIIGHSDNTPIHSLRFSSNWELSLKRANSVQKHLTPEVEASRMRAEGRADSEPLAPNDSPANRAKNRRVDIWLLVN